MDVQSLGLRTDVALLRLGGSAVTDRGTHLVVRTPDNPAYFWGNFLLLPAPPPPDRVDHWLGIFHDEFPEAAHVALALDRTAADDPTTEALRERGLRIDAAVTMTASSVHAPSRPHHEAILRRLAGDDDWAQQVELSLVDEDDVHLTREFFERKDRSYRALTEAGHGAWWGAFVDHRLVASLGVFRAGDGLARFQHVKTHPDFRHRGLAGALVHVAGQDALEELAARHLVMVADPDYSAIRVYRSLGFLEGHRHVEATLLPPVRR